MPAGKFITFVASGVPFFLGAGPDLTLPAMHKRFVGQAAPAADVFDGKTFAVGEGPFARNASLVKTQQPFLEFEIVVAVCDIDGTDAAIKTARGNKIGIDFHPSNSS
jgi:hypothetical protein